MVTSRSDTPGMEQITLVFYLITRYAVQQGWIPIGWRAFQIGPWDITVNGTPHTRTNIPPYHALIAHREVVSFMLLSPFGGQVGGWSSAEDAFIRDLETALAAPVTADAVDPHAADSGTPSTRETAS